MRKTVMQSEFKAKKKIKIPNNIKKVPQFQNQYERINKQADIISKKQIINFFPESRSTNRQMISQQLKRYDSQDKFRPTLRTAQNKKRSSSSNLVNFQSLQKKQEFKIKVTGAGFRKRIKSVSSIQFKKKNDKVLNLNFITKKHPISSMVFNSKQAYEDPLKILKEYYSVQLGSNQPKNQQKNICNQVKMKKMDLNELQIIIKQLQIKIFGIKPENQFQITQEHPYYQDFMLQNTQWQNDLQNYKDRGFSAGNNLSDYDYQLLDDSDGSLFLQKRMNQIAQSPYFENIQQNSKLQPKYKWMSLKVVGFDRCKNKAKVLRDQKIMYISRLSLKFADQKIQDFWKRIHNAKIIRTHVRQAIKYIGYLDNRSEKFNLNDVCSPTLPQHKLQQVIVECHNRYAKHFLIFWQMFIDMRPFKNMGIFKKQYTPFKTNTIFIEKNVYAKSLKMIQKQHYSSFDNLAYSLRIINRKLEQYNKCIFDFPTRSMQLQNLRHLFCIKINQIIDRFCKQTREVLISEIIYSLRNSLGKESKVLQKRYHKLHKYLFRDSVITILYYNQCQYLLNYYQQFTKWTPSRPSPSVILTVSIDNKLPCVEPSQQTSYNLLLQPFQLLYKRIRSIADLQADLVYTNPQNINPIYKFDASETIKSMLQQSYSKVSNFLYSMNSLLKYLEIPSFGSLEYSFVSIDEYCEILQSINSDLRLLVHTTVYQSGILQINLDPFKKAIKKSIQSTKIKLFKKIQKKIASELQNKNQQCNQVLKNLQKMPQNQLDYVKMRQYLNKDCQIFVDNLKKHYDLTGKYYSEILEKYYHQFNRTQFQKYIESVSDQVILLKYMDNKKIQMTQLQRKFIEKINHQREQILKSIDEIKLIMESLISLSIYTQYKQNHLKTARTYHQLEVLCKSLEDINYRQQLLSQDQSVFPLLPRLTKTLQPYFKMWYNINKFKYQNNDWHEISLIELNYQTVKQQIEQYSSQLLKLSKFFQKSKNMQAMIVCENGLAQINKMMEKLWIIESFTKQGMLKKPKMMASVLGKVYGPQAPQNLKNMNMRDLLSKGVSQHQQFIKKTADKAQKIWELQKKINQIIMTVKQLNFEIKQKYGVPFLPKQVLMVLVSTVKQNIQHMNVLKCEQQAQQLNKKLSTVYQKLKIIQDTIQTIIQFEDQFFKIFRIFKIDQINNQLPDQKRKISDILRLWVSITKHFQKDLQVWQAIDSQSYRNRISKNTEILRQICQAIKQYFNNKRLLFPRLFFITDQELIQSIVNQDYSFPYHRLRRLFSVQKLIEGSKGLEYMQGNGIIKKQQKLKLIRPVANSLMIWDKLKLLKEQMMEKMKLQCSGIDRSQILILQMLKQMRDWTTMSTQYLRKNNLKGLLTKYIENIKDNLPNDVFNASNIIGLKNILRDLLSKMIHKNVGSLSDFEWMKMIKIQQKRNSETNQNSLILKTLSYSLNSNYQYIGVDLSPFINLLATNVQGIHMMLALRNTIRMCGSINGSKHQTQIIRAISYSTLSHYAQVQYFQQNTNYTNGIAIKELLKGFYMENIWGVLSFVQESLLYNKEVMSIFSEAANQIKKAMTEKQIYCQSLQVQINNADSCKGMGLYIHLPQNSRLQWLGGPNIFTLRNVYRDISIAKTDWKIYWRYYLSFLKLSDEQIFQIVSQIKVSLDAKQIAQNFLIKLIPHLFKKITSNHSIIVSFQQVSSLIYSQIYSQAAKSICQFQIQIQDSQINQKQVFTHLINDCLQNQEPGPHCLVVYGDPDSGKTTLIETTLNSRGYRQGYQRKSYIKVNSFGEIESVLDLKQPQIIIYEVMETIQKNYSYIKLFEEWSKRNLQLNICVIFQTNNICNLSDTFPVQKTQIFYKQDNINWKTVFISTVNKSLQKFEVFREQIIRQVPLCIQKLIQQTQQDSIISRKCKLLCLEIIKNTKIFCLSYQQKQFTSKSVVQLVFMICIWAYPVYFNLSETKHIKFDELAEVIGSSFIIEKTGKNIFDYYYDMQKEAWLQWYVLDMPTYYQDIYIKFEQIYIPLKETSSSIYFSDIYCKHNDLSIIGQVGRKGVGLTKLAKKVGQQIKQNSCFIFNINNSWNGTILNKFINSQYPSRKPDGFYVPYKNAAYTIILDDISLQIYPETKKQHQKIIKSLLKYRCEFYSSKKISKTKFILCADQNLNLSILKQTSSVWVRSLCQDSMKTLFQYILNWFFGSTDNPFSKQVRDVSNQIINKSLILYLQNSKTDQKYNLDKFSKSKFHLNFSTLNLIFNFLCNLTPRSIKSAQDILTAWEYQTNRIYNKGLYEQQDKILAKLDQGDYQLVNRLQAQKYLIQKLSQNYHSISNYPLIYYEQFVHNIFEDTRLFLQLNASVANTNNLLKLGNPKVGKKTTLKSAKFITTSNPQIGNIYQQSAKGWKQDLYIYFGKLFNKWMLNNYQYRNISLQLLVFNIHPECSRQYIEVIVEYLSQRQSKSLLYESIELMNKQFQLDNKSMTLLSCLNINSHYTAKYHKFVEICRKKLKIGVLGSQFPSINSVYPQIIKYCPIISIQRVPTPQQAYYSISKSSLKIIYHQIFNQFNQQQLSLIKSITKNCSNVQQPTTQFQSETSLKNQIQIMNDKLMKTYKILQNFSLNKNQSKKYSYNGKQKILKWMRISIYYYLKTVHKNIRQIKQLCSLLNKRQVIQKQKHNLQTQVASLRPKLKRVSEKNQVLYQVVKTHQDDYDTKKNDFKQQNNVYIQHQTTTEQMQKECQDQLDSVTPILESAQKSLEKVTRDDINQLRSFPNPPLSAARVVQALCFVFNQDHLVKQKVLETGQRVKDYWDYAKKFILNDKLLKRVVQFKPEFIKNLNKKKMEILKKITQKPEFEQERVFKASSAAGNLSVWMRAIVQTFAVMQIIEPKRKLLRQALQQLKVEQQKLQLLKNIMQQSETQYLKKKNHYDGQMAKQKEIQDKILWLQIRIERGQKFLLKLSVMQEKWRTRIEQLVTQKLKNCRIDAILLSLLETYLTNEKYSDRAHIIDILQRQQVFPNLKNFDFKQNQAVSEYTWFGLENSLPITNQYSQNTIKFVEQLLYYQQNTISDQNKGFRFLVVDQTQSLHHIIKKVLQKENKSKFTKDIMCQIQVIDCLQKSAQQIFNQICDVKIYEDQDLENKECTNFNKYFIILNLQHNQQALRMIFKPETCSHGSYYLKLSQYNMLIFIDNHKQIDYLWGWSRNQQIPNIYNLQSVQTIYSLLQIIITDNIDPSNIVTSRNSIKQNVLHQHRIRQQWDQICEILKITENILLHDANIQKWMTAYQAYQQLTSMSVQKLQTSKFVRQIIVKLSNNQCWKNKRRLPHYLQQFQSMFKQKGRECLGTINEQLSELFQTKNNRSIYPINIISEQFTKQHTEINSNKFLNLWKHWLLSHHNLCYVFNTKQLVPYMQKQSQILLMVSNHFDAYQTKQAIISQYQKYMAKLQQQDDLFERDNHPFKAHILIVPDYKILSNYKGKQISRQLQGPLKPIQQIEITRIDKNQRILKDFQICMKMYKNNNNVTKAENNYIMNIIQGQEV